MTTFSYILLSFIFVFLNGFFVAAEFAIVKMRYTRVQTLENMKGLRGKLLAKIHKQLDAYLSACQLGITLASLSLGWIGEPAFAHLVQPLFHFFNVGSPQTIAFFSFLFAFSVITYLHIVVGELMPKTMAIRQTEFMALWTAPLLYFFYWLMYPAIWLLNSSSNFFLKFLKLDKVHAKENLSYSPEEIKLILSNSHLYGEFTESELELLTKSLIFTDLEISDVMRPISEMVGLNVIDPLDVNIQKMVQYRYSRYPVYKQQINHILGVLHVKDLFSIVQQFPEVKSLNKFIRPILKVKDTDSVLDVFHKFRQGKPHFAIVYSARDAIGFVTLDNLLQAIIGVIKDEFHLTQEDWIILEDGNFIIKGSASIFTLETLLGIELPYTQINTVSGLILDKLQNFPKEGETIDFGSFILVVSKIRGPKILQVRVYKKTEPKGEESGSKTEF